MKNVTNKWLRLALVGAVLGFGAFALLGNLLARPPAVEFTLPPSGTPGTADSMESAVRQADLVVVGVIVSSREGRSVGPTDEPGVDFFETALQVVEVVKDADSENSKSVDLGEIILVETESESDVTRPEKGRTVVALLWLKRDAESGGKYYRPITPGAWFYVDGDRLTSILDREVVEFDRVTVEIEQLRMDDLRDLLAANVDSP